MFRFLFPEGPRRLLARIPSLTREVPRPWFLLILVALAALTVLAACGGDGDGDDVDNTVRTATPPSSEGTATVETGTPEGTPVATPAGER